MLLMLPYRPLCTDFLKKREHCSRGFTPAKRNTFIAGCVPEDGCTPIKSLAEAKRQCTATPLCGGITMISSTHFEMRTGVEAEASPGGETSFIKLGCDDAKVGPAKRATNRGIWGAFSHAMDRALDNKELNLDADLGDPRTDDSIFLSIASYRDPSCRATLRKAFSRADHPEKLFVGIVQQNCETDCMTGTGWGNTRRWVRQDHPDPDCVDDFCNSPEGMPHCNANRVRIIRLPEQEALRSLLHQVLKLEIVPRRRVLHAN